MQIQFDPKALDLGEALFLLGTVMPAFLKGCRAQGDTLDEVQAGMAELVAGLWQKIPSDDTKG